MREREQLIELKRHCAVCGSIEGVLLHEQTFSLEKGHPLPDSYQVVSCRKCSNVFADLAVKQTDYDHFYEFLSKYENETISSGSAFNDWDINRLRKTANKIIEKIGTRKDYSVLDIGSAQGGLLEIFREFGFTNLYALEPSPSCNSKTAQNSNSIIKTITGSICQPLSSALDKKFDVVILSHVLEHIYSVEDAIKNIRSIMAPEGILYIEVPDASRYLDFYKTPFHFFDIEHINHFTVPSLISLLCMNNFKPLEFGTKDIEVSSNELYPALYGFFTIDQSTEQIKNYINRSNQLREKMTFSNYVESQIPIAIWGVGSYTKQLLSNTRLSACNIVYLVDGDCKKWGSAVSGIEIKDPKVLEIFNGTILIISALYAEEIKKQISNMGLTNKYEIIK